MFRHDEAITLLKAIDSKLEWLIRLSEISNALKIKGDRIMDADIQKLIDQAKANTNAEASALTAIQGLAAKLAAAIGQTTSLTAEDRAILQQEVADMQASAAILASAVVANTPAAGQVPGAPAPTQTPGTTV